MSRQFFNPFPKYLQIRQLLERRIDRELKVGDQLPTEEALCGQFGVSRETVREALRGLEEDRLILRSPGRGTFVRKRPPRATESRLTGMSEDWVTLGFDTEARLLGSGPVVAPEGVAEAVGVPDGSMVYRIDRLRVLDGQPFSLHESFFPLEVGLAVGRLDLRRTSIVREMHEKLGLDPWEDNVRVEAVIADAEIAARLAVGMGAPLLQVTRHFLLGRTRVGVLFRSYMRADRYYFTVKLAQTPARKARAAAAGHGLRAAARRGAGELRK